MRRQPLDRLLALVLVVAAGVVCLAGSADAREAAIPSAKARMICADEAQEDLAGVLAVDAKVTRPTWRDRIYGCTYRYPSGSFDISVIEFPKIASANADFLRLAADPAVTQPDLHMADGAFVRGDGSIAVRTDRRILEIDPTHLPTRFAKLKLTRSAVAQTVATVILRCWKG
jgi:hypothetical protein